MAQTRTEEVVRLGALVPGDTRDVDFIEEMDRGYQADLVRDPYPVYHELRRESPVFVGHLWQRLGLPPDLHLDPEAEDLYVRGLVFRSPNRVPVRFTPAGGAA